jgi:hypothetical protein
MNLEEWSLSSDVPGLAVHSSGLMVRINGSPTNPSEVRTMNVPEGLHFHDQARLLRAGMDFLAQNIKTIPLSRRIKSSPELAKRERTEEEGAPREDFSRAYFADKSDWSGRSQRQERSEKQERSDWSDKSDRYNRSDSFNRPDNYNRPDSYNRSDSYNRPDNYDRSDRYDRYEGQERSEKQEKTTKIIERSSRADSQYRLDSQDRSDRPQRMVLSLKKNS